MIGWIETVEEVTTDDMYSVLDLEMMFVSISTRIKHVRFTNQNRTSVQPSLGGMRTWFPIVLGTKLSNYALAFVNQILQSYLCLSSKVTWIKTRLLKRDSEIGPKTVDYSTGNSTRRLRGQRMAFAGSL